MTTTGVRVVVNPAGIAEVGRSPALGRELLARTRATIVPAARSLAPRRSGAGAGSIDAVLRVGEDGAAEVRVSWSRAAYYMRFQDTGTIHLAARRFMEQAAEQFGGHAIPKGSSSGGTRRARKKPSRAKASRYVVTRPDGTSYAGTRSAARKALKAGG
jgi:HK97 gp10 family phage protein